MPVDEAAISLTLHEIAAHPAVVDLGALVIDGERAHVTFGLELGFGSRWIAEGSSPTGVRPTEEVRLDFSCQFPSVAASPSLRRDFSRDHPHIQPWPGAEDRVVPCLVDGSIDEFAAAHGYFRIVDQFVMWLRAAAEGRLIDPAQGWEPMRRDECDDYLLCDRSQLHRFADTGVGSQLFRTSFAQLRSKPDEVGRYFGELVKPTIDDLTTFELPANDTGSVWGRGIALAVWAAPADKAHRVRAIYTPDTIKDLDGLRHLAADVGFGIEFEDSLSALRRRVPRWQLLVKPEARPGTLRLPVIFLVRRPVALIGSDSDIEVCAYLVSLPMTQAWDNAPVSALAVRDAISSDLLKRMSGDGGAECWMLLGCGSVGSKIALHRTRAGAPPESCVDHAILHPHNVARHALYPDASSMQSGWMDSKAEHLAGVIARFNLNTTPIAASHIRLMERLGQVEQAPPPWLVNTTASTVVREDLAYASPDVMPRVVEACLFGRGKLGYFSVEGANRNPDTAELFGEFYRIAARDAEIGSRLFDREGEVRRVSIGQGCSSVTMVLSDAELDLMASPFSELVASLASSDEPGRIDLLVRDRLNLRHTSVAVASCRRVPLEGIDGWTLSISQHAYEAIQSENARYPAVETGGVLVGWVSMLARRIYVVDVAAAPSDSARSASEFVLGTEGLAERLDSLSQQTAGALVCAGTWHSHLGAATPSIRDRVSAALVGVCGIRPMAFLINGSDGLRALSAAAPVHTVQGA